MGWMKKGQVANQDAMVNREMIITGPARVRANNVNVLVEESELLEDTPTDQKSVLGGKFSKSRS